MSPGVRSFTARLGVPGLFCLVAALLLILFVATGHNALTALDLLVMAPFALWLSLRVFRHIQRKSLWSVRNRLLFVYGLFGALPLLLILTLVGLGSWALMNELAIYLASTALEHRLDSVAAATDALGRQPPSQRVAAGTEIWKAFERVIPGIVVYSKDQNGQHIYPAGAPLLAVPDGWKSVHGLLVINNRFYGWSHVINEAGEFTALAPLTNEVIENLVPHLGEIALVENPGEADKNHPPAATGSLEAVSKPHPGNEKDFDIVPSRRSSRVKPSLPPAMSRLDVPVFIASTQQHYHLTSPGQTFSNILWVHSRPSAVLRVFFSGSEVIRDILLDAIYGIAVLFLVVELIAIWIGVSLSRRITGAVNQLYEGTRRVISGDFRHRIPVRDRDQLGDLAQSFNQMTGNLERLLVIEKERERLQTELEIAREVQGQLYPKAAPPTCGLKLSVRCDPARMVSGDYYDYLQISSGKLVFAIGDIAGKGISAALLMATLQSALRAQVGSYTPTHPTECSPDPQVDAALLVSKLNKQIYAHTSPEKYATFFFAVFDENTCSLTYTNAGHLSPLLFRGQDVTALDSNGTVVGIFPNAVYEESCLSMHQGDLLVCYTDGITEPENAFGEMFGEERLIDLVQKHRHEDDTQIVDIVLDAVRSWTGLPELHDDMTLLLARPVGTAL